MILCYDSYVGTSLGRNFCFLFMFKAWISVWMASSLPRNIDPPVWWIHAAILQIRISFAVTFWYVFITELFDSENASVSMVLTLPVP